MKASAVRRSGMSAVAATLMALLLAGQAVAASWSTPTTFWASGGDTWAWAGHLATLEPATAIAVYQETHPTDGSSRIFARRSTDGGASWASPVLLSRPGTAWSYKPHIAAHGQDVDVVWTEKDRATDQSHIRYARSTDGGATFTSSVALSPHAYNYNAKVARGPDGRVAVAWYNEAKVRTLMRVSTNGGTSFAARQVVVSSVSQRDHAVAVGDGVIYLGYTTWRDGIWLRRSTDDGASWSTATKLTAGRTGRRGLSLAAEGDQAYIGFARKSSAGWTPSVRRSVDKGASWSGQVHLAVPGANARPPLIALQGGIARAAFARCKSRGCDLRVFYRQSLDGLDWTPAERVSPAGSATPFGVGYAGGKILVGYEVYNSVTDTYLIEVRAGTP